MSEPVRLSTVIGPAFVDLHREVRGHEYTHWWLKGGRGSLKSTFASIEVVMLLLRHPEANAVVLRKVAKTIRKSAYAQILWTIGVLGLSSKFRATTSPMEITYRPTGQKIVFEGLDAPEKIKSLKFECGYAAVVWFEEVDQFSGMEEIRSVHQSLLRGGDLFWVFYSYNPPRSRDNWVNKLLAGPVPDGWRVHESCYLEAPEEWLGEQFISEAEDLKALDEKAYRHEYLGEAVGCGGNVFENVTLRAITDEEIATFDHVYNGVDFGFWPDPWTFGRVHYAAAQKTLYLFDGAVEYKASDEQTAGVIKARLSDQHGNVRRETVTCDSAEPKAISKYRGLGLDARGALKGPGSVEHGMKWLATRVEIVIDPARDPLAAKEFVAYEHERTKDGEYVSSYPDADNHSIDRTRYALERVINRRANV
ncbi:MAG: PBSX family phage terminase large subunit [Coriobacteriia bacterium]